MSREKKREYILFLAWIASFLATSGSLYFSEVLKFEPCTLCWYQRIFMYPLVILLGIAVARKDYKMASYSLVLASIGISLSTYHYAIQKIPTLSEGGGVACGRIPCTGDYLNWYGFITIPLLAWIAFFTIIIFSVVVMKLSKEENV